MRLKEEKGVALVFAFMLLTVIPIFAAAIYQYANVAIDAVSFKQDRTKAYYLARAGAEAAIEAWYGYELDQKPSGEVETLIVDENYNFIRANQWSNDSGKKKIGEIKVIFSQAEDHSTLVSATADVEGISHSVVATISPYVSGLDMGWYYIDEGWFNDYGIINPGPYTSDPIIVDSWLADFLGISQAEVKYHNPVYGVVECGRSDLELYLQGNNERNKVAYLANTIFFNSPLDLRQYFPDYGALIVSGETLVFNKIIQIRKGLSAYGSLILYLPDGLGVELEGHDGLYGKVYFQEGVIKEGVLKNVTIIDAGKSFYFKKLDEGLDLIAWSEGEYPSDVLIAIPEDDKNYNVPRVRDEIWVFWN